MLGYNKFDELDKIFKPIVYDLAQYTIKDETLRFHYSVGDVLIVIKGLKDEID